MIEDSIRKEIRKFASESNKADVAVVFYAGHGAQLSGSNYLLPIDIDVPHTEADIQFAGLKVDDLINSIGSNTKIVFLMPAGIIQRCLKTSSRDAVVHRLAWRLPRHPISIRQSLAVAFLLPTLRMRAL